MLAALALLRALQLNVGVSPLQRTELRRFVAPPGSAAAFRAEQRFNRGDSFSKLDGLRVRVRCLAPRAVFHVIKSTDAERRPRGESPA